MSRERSSAVSARALAASALVFLFLAEAQRALFASLFALWYDAAVPAFRPGAAALAVLPLAALFAPLLPLTRWVDRGALVAMAAAGVAVFRLPMAAPDLAMRTLFGALVLGCAALFILWAVGFLEARAVAGGAVVGLVADQLVRLGGVSYDLSQQRIWLPVQVVLSLVLLALSVTWARPASPRTDAARLERRAGGLRLRGALALGALLFLDLHALGLPPVIARWSRVSWELATLSAAVTAGIAIAVVLGGRGPVRGRMTALLLLAVTVVAVAAGWWAAGPGPALLMTAGHGAALILLAGTLSPASGRRHGAIVTGSFALFAVLTALYALSFSDGFIVPMLRDGAPWVFGLALFVLAAGLVLLPQPADATPMLGPAGAAIAGLTVPAVAATLVLGVLPEAPPPVPTATGIGAADEVAPIRAATYNIRYGFDEQWTFDPASTAAVIREAAADIVALQAVPAGLPTAYGADLALWLERRLGVPAFFAPTQNGLLGEAWLSKLPTRRVEATPLPSGHDRARHLVRLHVMPGGRSVVFYGLHLRADEREGREQVEAAVEAMGSTRAVVLGDMEAEADRAMAEMLRTAGYRAVLEHGGAVMPPGGALEPATRMDWIWVRGLDVVDARVLDPRASAHRLGIATLELAATQ